MFRLSFGACAKPRRWTDGANLAELVAGFDQEAAAVVVARLATFKMEAEEDFDATRWIDRTLIRLASRCALSSPACIASTSRGAP